MKKIKNKKIFVSFLTIFLVGLAIGLIFLFLLTDIDKTILVKQIEEYLSIVNSNNYNYLQSFLNSFKINFIYITIIWSVGILFIFFPINYFIIFYKGFLLGFLTSTSIFIFGIKGLFFSVVFSFPHEFINVVIMIILSIISIKFSKKIYNKLKNNDSTNLKIITKNYFYTYLIFLMFSIISVILEIYLNSFLIRVVL